VFWKAFIVMGCAELRTLGPFCLEQDKGETDPNLRNTDQKDALFFS